MKKIFSILCGLALTTVALADIPDSRTLELTAASGAGLRVYQSNKKTYEWTVRKYNVPQNITGYTPFMWIAPSNGSSGIVTGSCSGIGRAIAI